MVKAKFKIDGKQGEIPVHFNPSEYTIVTNTGDSTDDNEHLTSRKKELLSMQLTFDTYTVIADRWGDNANIANRPDVRMYTEQITSLVIKEDKKPIVTFSWGSLNFKGIVESVSQRFTMFLDDGKPVRAVLDVVMRGVDIDESKPASGQNVDWSSNDWKNVLQTAKPRELLEIKQ